MVKEEKREFKRFLGFYEIKKVMGKCFFYKQNFVMLRNEAITLEDCFASCLAAPRNDFTSD